MSNKAFKFGQKIGKLTVMTPLYVDYDGVECLSGYLCTCSVCNKTKPYTVEAIEAGACIENCEA